MLCMNTEKRVTEEFARVREAMALVKDGAPGPPGPPGKDADEACARRSAARAAIP